MLRDNPPPTDREVHGMKPGLIPYLRRLRAIGRAASFG